MKALALLALLAAPVVAQGADIVLLGETHDNPGHHAAQAAEVARLAPAALVFEMLTPAQAAAATPTVRGDAALLEAALGWNASGWPDFAMYHPVFAAAPSARIYGAALPRTAAREALGAGIAAYFGAGAAAYGLTEPLPPEAQTAREAEQRAAHCDALPEEMLPGMVDLQRLRDALLARAALQALDATGGPVAVIAGNGHVRRDGIPAALERARPGVSLRAVGQAEDGRIEGTFDEVWPGEAVDRGDPCAALRKG